MTAEEDPEEQQQVAAGRWDSFWGYDLVHAKGLLDKTYAKLQIKQHSWSGLKELPEVIQAMRLTLISAIKSFRAWSLRSYR